MSQYHAIANLTRRQGYSPSGVGTHLQLIGIMGSETALAPTLIALAGDWKGDRIAIVGDYAEDGDLPDEAMTGIATPHAVWPEIVGGSSTWINIEAAARAMLVDSGRATFKRTPTGWYHVAEVHPRADLGEYVIVNLDARQKLTPTLLGDHPDLGVFALTGYYGGTITAMAVLLAVSNGRGGGDFRHGHPLVGSWGGHRLAALPAAEAEDYEDITATMRDVLTAGHEAKFVVSDDGTVRRYVDPWEAEATKLLDIDALVAAV